MAFCALKALALEEDVEKRRDCHFRVGEPAWNLSLHRRCDLLHEFALIDMRDKISEQGCLEEWRKEDYEAGVKTALEDFPSCRVEREEALGCLFGLSHIS